MDGRSARTERAHPGRSPRKLVEGRTSRRSTCGRAKVPSFFGCRLDGTIAMPCFGAPNFYDLKEGRPCLKVWSVDLAYNRSVSVRLEDRPHAPVLTPAGRADRKVRPRGPGEVTFNVSQSEKGQLWCSLDGVEFTHVLVARSTTRIFRAATTRSRCTRSTRPATGRSSPSGPGRLLSPLLQLLRPRITSDRRAVVRIAPRDQELDRRPQRLRPRIEPERHHDEHDDARRSAAGPPARRERCSTSTTTSTITHTITATRKLIVIAPRNPPCSRSNVSSQNGQRSIRWSQEREDAALAAAGASLPQPAEQDGRGFRLHQERLARAARSSGSSEPYASLVVDRPELPDRRSTHARCPMSPPGSR